MPLCGDSGWYGLCVIRGLWVEGYRGVVQLWPPPGMAVGLGPGPPVNRLWKMSVRVALSRLATSGLISSSAFCTGDNRWRTSSCEQRRRERQMLDPGRGIFIFKKRKTSVTHSAESHVERRKVLQSRHGLEGTKVLQQPVFSGLIPPHTPCKINKQISK